MADSECMCTDKSGNLHCIRSAVILRHILKLKKVCLVPENTVLVIPGIYISQNVLIQNSV